MASVDVLMVKATCEVSWIRKKKKYFLKKWRKPAKI